jgi:predicted regulator of Ras-like GTPase activity (Roadblock/LC7/MglB family)
MAFEDLLSELKSIKGYVASGIMQFTGELLAADTTTGSVDLALVGATFNDIFRSAHEVCGKIGLEATREMVLYTPKGVIVMMCTGAKERVHVHLITFLTVDGNQALAKLMMQKIAPEIMKVL